MYGGIWNGGAAAFLKFMQSSQIHRAFRSLRPHALVALGLSSNSWSHIRRATVVCGKEELRTQTHT
jgi:hypothetical protein